MDGLRGVWHGGPFSRDKRYRFYPKQMKFGTDPVAIDRFLIDVIDNKRKQEGAISVWERDMKYFSTKLDDWQANPNINRFIREPGHIEYASKARPGRLRHRQDPAHGNHRMKTTSIRCPRWQSRRGIGARSALARRTESLYVTGADLAW